MEAEPDEQLIGSVLRQGSQQAFGTLYRRHTPKMFGVARRLLDSDDDAEDAIQESWIRAARGLAGYAGRASLQTWLIGIVINVSREQLARRGRWPEVPLDGLEPATAEVFGSGVDIERAIHALPPSYRTAFVLHDIEGFTHEEIGVRCGWTSGTSKTLLFRARRALRAALEPTATEETPR